MKFTVKKLFVFCMLVCFPVIFLQMLRVSVSLPSTSPVPRDVRSTMSSTTNAASAKRKLNCSVEFRDPLVLEKLFPGIDKMKPSAIREIIETYAKECNKFQTLKIFGAEEERGNKTEVPRIRTVRVENHFFHYSPRVALENDSAVPAQMPMCPEFSPHLQGHIDVELLGKLCSEAD